MGFCSCSSKILITIINLFFWAGAALLIFAGVVYVTSANSVIEDSHHYKPAYITFAIAAFLFLCGLVGIIGAFSEKKIFLGTFVVVSCVTLVLLVAASAVLFVNYDSALNATDDYVVRQYNNYGNPSLTVGLELTGEDEPKTSTAMVVDTTTSSGSGFGTTTATSDTNSTTIYASTAVSTTTTAPKGDTNATNFIDSIQESLECCGWNNYTDWNDYEFWAKNLTNIGYVPNSCCNKSYTDGNNMTCPTVISMDHKDFIYTNDCKSKVDTAVKYGYMFLSWTAVAFAILMFLGFAGAIYLMCRKRSSDEFNYSSIA